MRKKILLVLLGLVFCAGIYTFYEYIAGGKCNPNGTALLVKTALDANTATKKVELAAYAGDKLRREKLNEIYYFFIVKQILYLHNSNNITKIA